ncbi:protein of unknown function [Xenorhabdus poinarii G6]|uniref:Uncharacterized protein n=1 Tax=Xenorhabdus poinarii G6 TaxID=1354304 RepID=A0A068R5M7_9GAMM|nr:protein of unknown function [Xenorhabdus poinarii G6]
MGEIMGRIIILRTRIGTQSNKNYTINIFST